jgi:hypothetical protein
VTYQATDLPYMKLARDLIYKTVTRSGMKRLIEHLLLSTVHLEKVDEKIYTISIPGINLDPGFRIWTEDFKSWNVKSDDLLRIRKVLRS